MSWQEAQGKVKSGLTKVLIVRLKEVAEFAYHLSENGFGGLEVACWPLVPKFAGSNPAEDVGFFKGK